MLSTQVECRIWETVVIAVLQRGLLLVHIYECCGLGSTVVAISRPSNVVSTIAEEALQ